MERKTKAKTDDCNLVSAMLFGNSVSKNVLPLNNAGYNEQIAYQGKHSDLTVPALDLCIINHIQRFFAASSSVRLLWSKLPRKPKESQTCGCVLQHLTFRNSCSGRPGVSGDLWSLNCPVPVTASVWSCYHTAGFRAIGGSGTPGVSKALSSNFWQGPVTALAWSCSQSAGYRTAAGHRSPARGRDNTDPDSKGQSLKTEERDGDNGLDKGDNDKPAESKSSGSIFQRFKQAYKEHGKILVGVHLATSLVWAGSFYYAASK